MKKKIFNFIVLLLALLTMYMFTKKTILFYTKIEIISIYRKQMCEQCVSEQ